MPEVDDSTVRLSTAWQVVRRRWRLLVALALVGAVLGALASFLRAPAYASVGKVLVQGISEEGEALAAEAQIAMSLIVLDRTAADLGRGTSGAELKDSVSVTPADGNVLMIRGVGPTPAAARELAAGVTEQYIRFSGELASDGVSETLRVLSDVRESLEIRVVELNARIAQLTSPPGEVPEGPAQGAELERLEVELTEATEALDGVDGVLEAGPSASRGSIGVIEPAAEPIQPVPPRLIHLVAGGAGLALVLGAASVLVARYRDDRLRHGPDVAAALGAPVLSSVPDQPALHEASAHSACGTWRGRLRWLVREDRRWDLPPGSAGPLQRAAESRYRQVLARFRSSGADLPLLVVVFADDADAQHAVGRLAVVAATHGPPVCVLTDEQDLEAVVRAAPDPDRPEPPITVSTAADDLPAAGHTVLRVVHVAAGRPIVPNCGVVAGVLLVVGAGTRTGWELVGLAQACADAGHPVTGALLVAPVAGRDVERGPARAPTGTAPRNGTPYAGVTGR